jgi:hypothetical protein
MHFLREGLLSQMYLNSVNRHSIRDEAHKCFGDASRGDGSDADFA